jgi:hypothetical protein
MGISSSDKFNELAISPSDSHRYGYFGISRDILLLFFGNINRDDIIKLRPSQIRSINQCLILLETEIYRIDYIVKVSLVKALLYLPPD